LELLIERARAASPNDRIELRDPIAAHGEAAIHAMAEWLADPQLTRFAVRVIGRAADLGQRDAAVSMLSPARHEATLDQQQDIDAELRRLGYSADRAPTRGRRPSGGQPPDPSVPGWMMRTDRTNAGWLWSEVLAGRLRQGWGYSLDQDLLLLRARRERGEPMSRDDDWAWPNRRMLADEPDGMQIGDLVFAPHLPQPWHWSILRVTGPYRYHIDADHGDFGHILPVEVLTPGASDAELTPALESVRRYPARLRRLSRAAYDDLQGVLGRG
jgi:hypothetical protein